MATSPYRENELDDSYPVYIYAHKEIKRPRGEHGIDRYVHEHTVHDEHEGTTTRHLVSRVYHLCHAGLHYRVYFQNRNLVATFQGRSMLIANALACKFVGPCDGACGDRLIMSPTDWPDSDERECFLKEIKAPPGPEEWRYSLPDKCLMGLCVISMPLLFKITFNALRHPCDFVVLAIVSILWLMYLGLGRLVWSCSDMRDQIKRWNNYQARLALGRETMGRRRVVLEEMSDASAEAQETDVTAEAQTELRRAGR